MNEDLCTCNHANGWQCTDGVPAGCNRRGPCACPCHLRKASQMEQPTAQPRADLLDRIPALVGMLRRGTSIVHPKYGRGIVLDPEADDPAIFDRVGHCLWSRQDLRDAPGLCIDLTDATARAHLAWWISARVPIERIGRRSDSLCSQAEWDIVGDAVWNQPMNAEDIDALARLALRLAEGA